MALLDVRDLSVVFQRKGTRPFTAVAGFVHQAQMPLMEIAHCRHEADAAARGALTADPAA